MKKLFLILVVFFFWFQAKAQTTLSDYSFSSVINSTSRLIVIDFYADWCKPCKMMAPIMSELVYEYSGSVKFYKMNIDYNSTDDQLGITSIPTFLFIKNGNIVSVLNGYTSKEDMEYEIETYK